MAAVQLAVAPDANRCFSVAAPKPALYSPHVKKTVLVYGLLGGVLIAALQLIQYRFLVLEHSMEIYGGLVALVFSALGGTPAFLVRRISSGQRTGPLPAHFAPALRAGALSH